MKLSRWLLRVAVLVLLLPAPARAGTPPVTAIMGALPSEIAYLKDRLTDVREQTILKLPFLTGELAGQRVVLAFSGQSKVNAAVITTLLIEHFHPRRLIFTGIAGALDPNLKAGDIVIGTRVVHHDLGRMTDDGFLLGSAMNPIRHERNPIFFYPPADLLALAASVSGRLKLDAIATSHGLAQPRVIQGPIATGDQFIAADEARHRIRESCQAVATEMEGAAVAQVCHQLEVPCLIIRSISDKADARAKVDMPRNRQIAMKNSAMLVMEILKAVTEGDATHPPTAAPAAPATPARALR